MQKNHLWLLGLALALLAAGCARGPTGPEGPPGVSMIAQYTGSCSTNDDYAVTVPEIMGRRTTTYVMVYWAVPGAPDIWTPMSDGWKDSTAESRTAAVSWTYGEVYLFGMSAGDMYLIQVFQHE